MVRQCYTPIAARTVKEALVECGCKAGSNDDTGRNVVYVYAYLMGEVTRQGDEEPEALPEKETPDVKPPASKKS
jgi:hypothetical protein